MHQKKARAQRLLTQKRTNKVQFNNQEAIALIW
jgi:hypothetical protein